jgi:hypothetical protein
MRLSRQNGRFSHPHASLGAVSAWRKAPFAALSPRQKFPFPARVETGSITGWWVSSLSPTTFATQHSSCRAGVRLFRVESERFELPTPLGRRVAEPLNADATW